MRLDRLPLPVGVLAALTLGVLAPAIAAPGPAPSEVVSTSSSSTSLDDDKWKDGKLQLLTTSLPAMLPGQQGWVGLSWTATSNVCDVEVTATGPGVTITYPENTGAFSSLYVRNALAETNRDYTALNIAVSPTVKGPVTVALKATYTRLQPGKIKKDDDLKYTSVDCTKGSPGGLTTSTATLPITAPHGPKVTLQTSALTVAKATPSWVNLGFTTTYAGLDGFRVTLSPPAGLAVVYPGDGSSSGLAGGSTLPVGGTDAAAVRLDASGLAPGKYQVPVKATWTGGSVDAQLSLTVK